MTMPRTLLFASVVLCWTIGTPDAALAQPSRCADCHIANPTAPDPRHVSDWDTSAHGRKDVGCERCHGGDPTTFESFRAHDGILPSRLPSSPTREWNLPKTCGVCHAGPYTAFQKSRHYEVLRSGDSRAPTCSTCHGDVGAYLLSPKSLEGRCNECHGPGKNVPKPESGARARLLLEGIREVRESLNAAQSLIRRVKDVNRRTELETAFQQAQVPITEAVDAGHSFMFDGVEERLGVARQRAAALMDRIIDPGSTPPPRH